MNLYQKSHTQGMIRPKGLYVAPKVLVGLGTLRQEWEGP